MSNRDSDRADSSAGTNHCEMYDCPTRERPVVPVKTLRAARSTTPVKMMMCQTCIEDGWTDEVLEE